MQKIQIYLISVIIIGIVNNFLYTIPILQILFYVIVAIISLFALIEYKKSQKAGKSLSKIFFWAFLAILIFSCLLVIETLHAL